MTIKDTNLCFVLEPTPVKQRDDAHPHALTHGDLNTIFNQIIEPSIAGRGFRIVRSSHITRSGNMTREHKDYTSKADLVIANITTADPIVMFCLALRYAVAKENPNHSVIGLLDREQVNIFDLPSVIVGPIPYGLTSEDHLKVETSKETNVADTIQSARNDLIHSVGQFIDWNKPAGDPIGQDGAYPAMHTKAENTTKYTGSDDSDDTDAFDRFLKARIRALLNEDNSNYAARKLQQRLFDHR